MLATGSSGGSFKWYREVIIGDEQICQDLRNVMLGTALASISVA